MSALQIVCLALVTYLERSVFLLWRPNASISRLLKERLRFLPASAMGALVLVGLYANSQTNTSAITPAQCIAVLSTLVCGQIVRNQYWALLAGAMIYIGLVTVGSYILEQA